MISEAVAIVRTDTPAARLSAHLPDQGNTIRFCQAFIIDASDVVCAKDMSAWTTPPVPSQHRISMPTEMEKVAVLGPDGDGVYPQSAGEDEVEQRTLKSSSWRHHPGARQASPLKQLAPGQSCECSQEQRRKGEKGNGADL